MDTLKLSGGGRTIDLYPWLNGKAQGHEALAGILGFGLPEITNHWFEGAGSGRTWRGARLSGRRINLPLKVYASNRAELNSLLSDVAVILDPFRKDVTSNFVARLYFGMPDGSEWYTDVVRASGGDWSRKTDSDDRTFFKTTLGLETESAFWTRSIPEDFVVRMPIDGPTLMPEFAKLQVASAAAFGEKDVVNVGDSYAWPVITVKGPTTRVLLIGADGETVEWSGSLLVGDELKIDMRKNLVEDGRGENRYDGLAKAPHFWAIEPGKSRVTIQADNITAESSVLVQYWPTRWGVV